MSHPVPTTSSSKDMAPLPSNRQPTQLLNTSLVKSGGTPVVCVPDDTQSPQTQCMSFDPYIFDYSEDYDDDGFPERQRFIDCPAESAEVLNNLLATYLPLGVEHTISRVKWSFRWTELTVDICHSNQDGLTVLASSDCMPRRRLDALRDELRTILRDALLEPSWNTMSFGIMLLQLAEESDGHLQDFHTFQPPKRKQKPRGWDATIANDWTAILNDPKGVDLLTVNNTAKFLLGDSISNICRSIENIDGLRVIHVEPVFRSDLVSRFLHRRREMEQELLQLNYNQLRECVTSDQLRSREVENSTEGIARHLCTPKITFHGAPRNLISSIVRYGFQLPGTKLGQTTSKVNMSCGASYGIGIYSSPSLPYATCYGLSGSGNYDRWGFRHPSDIPGFRLLVCATLMGRSLQVTRDETRRTEGVFIDTAQSHVSPNGLEYIVFNPAQIVPCYVLHMDYGSEHARKTFDELRNNPSLLWRSNLKSRLQPSNTFSSNEDHLPGAVKAKKEALKAAAMKWFPYGYGAAEGTRFVIEEIGEVSDDEEEYGEFQDLRKFGEEEYAGERDGGEKGSWFDEYQTVRGSNKDVWVER